MSVLAIIPARGGSKGIPGKNLRQLGGRPLIAWSILAAAAAAKVSRVVVSSDSPEILRVAEIWGAEAQARPPELATDTASTDAVLVDVIQQLQTREAYAPDVVVLLQPTVPLRASHLVDRCIEVLEQKGLDFVFTGYPLHFVWWRETPGADTDARTWATQCARRPRRQDMHGREQMWHEDGSVYVVRTDWLMRYRARLWVGGQVVPDGHRPPRMELVETERTPDIDTEADLLVAEALVGAPAPWKVLDGPAPVGVG